MITVHRRDQARNMGRYFTKSMFMLLTPILLLHLFISSSSGASVNSGENGVCISKEGRFPPYESEGKLPKSADLELRDLNLCKVFHGKTCCSASQMLSASLTVENLATYGEAVKDCLDLFELLECSICHPNFGVQSGTLRICASFCDRVFEACSDAYFSSDASNQVIVPCGASESTICGKASKWESNGTAFCDAVGFAVQTADNSVEAPCYGSKTSLEPVVESLIKTENSAWFQNLQKLVGEMTLVQLISWVQTLLVLVASSSADASYDPEGCVKIDKEHDWECLREDLTLSDFLSIAFKSIK